MKTLLATALAVVVLDQASKIAVMAALGLNASVEVIPGIFELVHFRNPGAAFGILNDGSAGSKLFLVLVSLAALALIAFFIRHSTDRLYTFALSLVAGGAAGNLIDRLLYGYVVDFLYFHIGEHYWPAFNVADSAITAGVALAAFSLLRPSAQK